MTPKACCAAALTRPYPHASGGSERNPRPLSSQQSSAKGHRRAPAWEHPLPQQQGFVLVATLWFVALLALVAVIIGGWVERSLGRAIALQDRVTARSEMIGAVNQITFLMLISYFSPRGIELLTPEDRAGASPMDVFGFTPGDASQFIDLDDRPYRMGDVVIRLQDDHGLYKLNFPDIDTLGRLLAAYGVSYEDSAVLNDRLLDYIDKSPLMRLNGANADSYLRAGRPPPRNNPLLTPWEAYRVLGWDDYPKLWNSPTPFPEVATVRDIGGLNPNTAPAAVLRSIPGLDERAVERLLDYRASQWILNELDLERATGVALPVSLAQFSFFPANSLRFTLLSSHDPLAQILEIRLNPLGPNPYRIDYLVERPLTRADRAVLGRADIPTLPLPDDLPLPGQDSESAASRSAE
jgi:general secretion pathway protein K